MEVVLSVLIEYALSVLPLSMAILSVPPLSSFDAFPLEQLSESDVQLFRFIYSIVPPLLLKKAYVNSLVLDSSNSTSLTPYVTHMFVHLNYTHLLGNLRGLITLGFPVFTQFGPLISNLMFLGGGIAGALNVNWQKLKVAEIESLQNNSLLARTSKVLNTVVESTVKTLDEVRGRQYLGASGGVCAFLGANLVLLTKDTYRCVQDLMHYIKQDKKSLREGGAALSRVIALLWNALQVSSIVNTMQMEVASLTNQVNKKVTVWDLFTFENVNHAAHVQGFLFGAGVTCGLLLIQSSNHNSDSDSSGSNRRWKGSGRRLGD